MIAWITSVWRRLWPGSRSAAAGLDPDLADIFFAEMTEVTSSLRSAAAHWRATPRDPEAIKQVRRGFHTLKGSAPLVGATVIGELCAELEQMMIRLAESPLKITPSAIGLVDQSVALLPELAEATRAGRVTPAQVRNIVAAAKRIA